jgi:HAD superfamily hydrolase (TIGR01509 family)
VQPREPADVTGPAGPAALPALGAVDAALFDLDGTLVDSEPVHRAAWRSFFDSRGWRVSEETYASHFVGRRGADAFRSVDGPWRDEDPDELLAEVLTHLASVSAEPGTMPGAAELVRRVHASGVPIAVVTSATRSWVDEALDFVGVTDLVSVVVSAEDVTAGKPDPEGYLAACDRLKVEPSAVAAFEDSVSGVTAAASAGIARVIGVLTTANADALRAAGAHHVVDSLVDLTQP